MIAFNNQAEFEDLLSNFTDCFKDNKKLTKFKNELAKHIQIVEDTAFEKRLDDLQNELAELEEIKDDLTVKLCYTRRDLCEELQTKFTRNINESTEFNIDLEENQSCNKEVNKKIKERSKENFDFSAIKNEIEKTKKILSEEVNKKTIVNFDVYKSAEMYFDSI